MTDRTETLQFQAGAMLAKHCYATAPKTDAEWLDYMRGVFQAPPEDLQHSNNQQQKETKP